MALDVCEARVVVDDDVQVFPAGPAVAIVLVAGDRVAGSAKRARGLTSMCSSAPGRDHS
jgi:hypothetical protein